MRLAQASLCKDEARPQQREGGETVGSGVQAAASLEQQASGMAPRVLLVLCAYRSPAPSYCSWALRGRRSASRLHGSALMPTADQQGESTFVLHRARAPCYLAGSGPSRSGAVGGGGAALAPGPWGAAVFTRQECRRGG